MNHDDFAFEPIRGLPAVLPEGETLLWQGSPDWKALAVRGYHVRKVAVYFLALAVFRLGLGVSQGHTPVAMLLSCAFLLALGGIAIGVLASLAYFNSRSTVYSITSKRVLLRHGIAVPMTMNIPFTLIESAGFLTYADGTGEVALRLPKDQRVGYLITWPHLRPGHITQPQPAFRALRDARQAADILAAALAEEAGSNAVRIDVEPAARPAAQAASRRHSAAAA
jgi:hypothetical protein